MRERKNQTTQTTTSSRCRPTNDRQEHQIDQPQQTSSQRPRTTGGFCVQPEPCYQPRRAPVPVGPVRVGPVTWALGTGAWIPQQLHNTHTTDTQQPYSQQTHNAQAPHRPAPRSPLGAGQLLFYRAAWYFLPTLRPDIARPGTGYSPDIRPVSVHRSTCPWLRAATAVWIVKGRSTVPAGVPNPGEFLLPTGGSYKRAQSPVLRPPVTGLR